MMIQKVKIAKLKPHKDNSYFFDEVEGEAWQGFIDSIKTSGIMVPIMITTDGTIVSGHQRVRACRDLKIKEIDADVREFDSEDEILKCLIETNIRQRGIGNMNPIKLGRCFKELERIYGVYNGSHQSKTGVAISNSYKTQESLANELGMSKDTWLKYKKLTDMIPEMQDLIETGIVTPSTARAIVKNLPEFQQKELADVLVEKFEDGATKKQVEAEIQRIKEEAELEKQEEVNAKIEEIDELKRQLEEKEDEIRELEEQMNAEEGEEEEEVDESEKPMSLREKFEKDRADRLMEEKSALEDQIKELKQQVIDSQLKESSEEKETSDSDSEAAEELKYIKAQMLANAKMELADFVKKYSEMLDVKELIKNALKSL